MLIFKISPRSEWEKIRGSYEGSAHDLRDGFIHFSTAAQLPGTLEKHYAGQDDLLLIAVEDSALGPALKYETSRGGDLFPHLYAALPLSAVRWTKPIMRNDNGFVLPLDLMS